MRRPSDAPPRGVVAPLIAAGLIVTAIVVVHEARATGGVATAPAAPAAPSPASRPPTADETVALLHATAFMPLEFATYDGHNEVAHPATVAFATPWHGHRYWMALTPYPNGDARFENPALYVGETGRDWRVPDGVPNPLARSDRGYLSDPSLVYDPDRDALRLYYREVVVVEDQGHTKVHVSDDVRMTESRDGAHWSDPRAMASDSGGYLVSPSVVRRRAADWSMWQVDAATGGCNATSTRVVTRRSVDGTRWSARAPVQLAFPGFTAWHLAVQYVPARDEYWALVAAYPNGRDCNGTSLFLATSRDGLAWTAYPVPVLAPGAAAPFSANVYQSSFIVDESGEEMTIWLTGAETMVPASPRGRAVLRWSAAELRTGTRALLERVAQAPRTTGGP